MFEWKFWRGAIERSIRTFVNSLLAMILAVEGFNAFSADWATIAATSGTAALVSLLVSISVVNVGEKGSASSIPEPQ